MGKRRAPRAGPHACQAKYRPRIWTAVWARVLVETGTFLGDMMEAQRRSFDRVYSIELHPKLAADAQMRFAAFPNVTIVQGDSGTALPAVLKEINQRAVFWLDGHWSDGITARGSKDTPILAELEAIAHSGARDSVILIDDARCFTGEGDYPTIDVMRQETAQHWDGFGFEVAEDIIRLTPPERT